MKILFTGGGTLGSVAPLLAIHERLHAPKSFWIGTRHGVEQLLIAEAGIPFFGIVTGKLRRYWDWRTLLAPLFTAIGFFQAFFLIARLRPTFILSAGGYVGVPVIFAGWLLGIPSSTLQLDVRPGLANRLITPFVRHIFVVFQESVRYFPKKKTIVTGAIARRGVWQNVSAQEEARKFFQLEKGVPTLLVLGGGTGALTFNMLIVRVASSLTRFCQVIHLVGKGKEASIRILRGAQRYHPFPFLTKELSLAYAVADCVITRAGMGTLSELAALRKAAIVIPLPETHQEDNAALLASHDAAVVVQQSKLTPEKFVALVIELLGDAPRRAALGSALHDAISTAGAEKIVQFLILNS